MSLFPQARAIPKKFTQGQPYNQTANTTHRWVVPDGKLWIVIACSMRPSDSSTTTFRALNETASEVIEMFLYNSATTAQQYGPEVVASQTPYNQCLVFEKEIIEAVFGSAQSSLTSKLFLRIIEYDLEEIFKGWKAKH